MSSHSNSVYISGACEEVLSAFQIETQWSPVAVVVAAAASEFFQQQDHQKRSILLIVAAEKVRKRRIYAFSERTCVAKVWQIDDIPHLQLLNHQSDIPKSSIDE